MVNVWWTTICPTDKSLIQIACQRVIILREDQGTICLQLVTCSCTRFTTLMVYDSIIGSHSMVVVLISDSCRRCHYRLLHLLDQMTIRFRWATFTHSLPRLFLLFWRLTHDAWRCYRCYYTAIPGAIPSGHSLLLCGFTLDYLIVFVGARFLFLLICQLLRLILI